MGARAAAAPPELIVVPGSAELLGTRRAVKVTGTAIGKSAAGEQVTVHLQQRLS